LEVYENVGIFLKDENVGIEVSYLV